MNIRNFFDSSVVSKEFFTKETMDAEVVRIPFHEFSGLELQGNIGENNYLYIKKSDYTYFSLNKKKFINVYNWSPSPLTDTQIFLLSRTGVINVRTRSSGGRIIIGHNFKGSFEARIINADSVLVLGDDVTCHGTRYQIHGNGIYIGRRCLFSEEVIIQGHDAHAIIDLTNNEVINSGDKITKISSYVWIGRRVTIMPGSYVGKGSVIGATSTVTKTIPPFSLAVGVPARVIKSNISWCRTRDEFDEKSKKIIEQLSSINN